MMFGGYEDKIMPEPNSGCWLWVGPRIGGYGAVQVDGKTKRAHRLVYEAERGPIPQGLVLDHLCRTPACVNPDHLEPVTFAENIRRGVGFTAINHRKLGCPKGHLYDYTDIRGGRVCLTCARESKRAWAARRRHKLRLAALTPQPGGE